ncbi:hypothetical protein CDAR_412021 [Caerostris darwini]|uniref:Uncharacterized protein n=1 Tax=Caerostris darwini TaxID=1538125 RepID=A0AAV4WEZ1_9ARAC|nr:hypothetical protein CDAR_412021 [Caerostris darwini]
MVSWVQIRSPKMRQLIPVAMRRRDYFITGRNSYRITFEAGRTFHLIRHPPQQRTPFDMTNRAETVQKLCDLEIILFIPRNTQIKKHTTTEFSDPCHLPVRRERNPPPQEPSFIFNDAIEKCNLGSLTSFFFFSSLRSKVLVLKISPARHKIALRGCSTVFRFDTAIFHRFIYEKKRT